MSSIFSRAAASLGAAFLCTTAAPAFADLYKWTDERGTTVISNVLPANPKKVSDFEVVLKEAPRGSTQKTPAPYRHEVTPTEQMLMSRIETLEREFQAQQNARETIVSSAPQYQGYYAAPAAPLDAAYPYGDSYYSSYYPSYVFPYPPSPFYSYYAPGTVVVGHRFIRSHGSFTRSRPGPQFSHAPRPGGRR